MLGPGLGSRISAWTLVGATIEIALIWHDSPVFDLYRGDTWMPEPCRSCDEKEKDFGGCRCQALLPTGDGANTDPACSKSPHHQLIRQAVELAQNAARPAGTLIPRQASQGVEIAAAP